MPILSFLLTIWAMATPQQPDSIVLLDFSRPEAGEWLVVNDGVMGGVSSSTMETTASGTGVFAGELSLENNGGFASVRTSMDVPGLSRFAGLVLRVRGDGRHYQVRLRTDDRFDGIAYRAEFQTTPDEWITVTQPFASFVPTFRGYVPPGAPPLDPDAVRQLGFLLADEKEGTFRLEVDHVMATHTLPSDP
jgi:hypothetical protein